MRNIQFKAHISRSTRFWAAILVTCGCLSVFFFMISISLIVLFVGWLIVTSIFLGAAYASLYWIAIEGDTLIVKHFINSAFMTSFDLRTLDRVEVRHITRIGQKIFLYRNGALVDGFNIDTLTWSDVRRLKEVLAEYKLLKT